MKKKCKVLNNVMSFCSGQNKTFNSVVLYNSNTYPIKYGIQTSNSPPGCQLTLGAKTAQDVKPLVYVYGPETICKSGAEGQSLCSEFQNNPAVCRLKDGVCYTQWSGQWGFSAWDGSQKK